MNLSGKIYSKTGKGVQALSSKSRQLSADSRKILASIDGKTDAETLMEQFQKLPDEAFTTKLAQLENDGYIRFLKNANWDLDDDSGHADAMVVDELSPEDFFAMTNEAGSENASEPAEKQEPSSPLPDKDLGFASSEIDTSRKTGTPPNINHEMPAEAEQQVQHDVSMALEEAERKQREDIERKAIEQAERKARKEEEERQRVEAEVITKAKQAVKQAAERIAREEAEARKRAEAEAREAAELEARLESECKAREKAERKAQEEAERKAHKEEQTRQKAEAEAIARAEKLARQEAGRIAKEEAKRQAAEEKALRQKAKDEARAIAEEATRLKAGQKAKEKAERKTERDAERASRPPLNLPLDLRKWLKAAQAGLLYLPLVLAALVAIMHVVNLRILASPMEKYVSEVVNEPVTIGQIRLSLLTSSLTLSEIKVESGADAGIGVIQLSPMVLLQSGKVRDLGVLEIEDIVVTRASIGRQLEWIKALAQNKDKLNIEEVALKNVSFSIPGLELEPFEGRITGLAGSAPGLIELESDDQRLNLRLEPIHSQYKVTVNASAWQPPFDTHLEFAELNAEGLVDAQQIRFDQIKAKLYSGTMTANVVIDWAGEPSITGGFEIEGLSLPVALSSMKSAASVNGTLQTKGSFTSTAGVVGQLADNLEINATFIALNGKINDVNLASKVASGGSRDSTTRFDKLTGNVRFKDGYYQYTRLALISDQFKAKGNLNIQPDQEINGKVRGELSARSRLIRSNLDLSGRVGSVKLN